MVNNVYVLELYYGLSYEGDGSEILGIYSTEELADKALENYKLSEDYKQTTERYDYAELEIRVEPIDLDLWRQ